MIENTYVLKNVIDYSQNVFIVLYFEYNICTNSVVNTQFVKQSKGGCYNNPCSVYFSKNGSYVVIDDITNEVVQFSQYGDKHWIIDQGIHLFK